MGQLLRLGLLAGLLLEADRTKVNRLHLTSEYIVALAVRVFPVRGWQYGYNSRHFARRDNMQEEISVNIQELTRLFVVCPNAECRTQIGFDLTNNRPIRRTTCPVCNNDVLEVQRQRNGRKAGTSHSAATIKVTPCLRSSRLAPWRFVRGSTASSSLRPADAPSH